jgi:hypothetical protein
MVYLIVARWALKTEPASDQFFLRIQPIFDKIAYLF